MYKTVDAAGTGQVAIEDIPKLFSDFGVELSDNEFTDFSEKLDPDGNGYVVLDDYLEVMGGSIERQCK